MEKWKKNKVKAKDTLSFNVPLSSDSNAYGTVTFQTKDLEKASHFPVEETEDTFEIPKELEDEIEKQLEEKAKKTNLTVANVKNMIRTVIMSEDVVKLVKATLTDCPVEPLRFEPKLTRAKKKELEKEWNWAVPLPPAKKGKRTGDDIVALIDQDLPEDSSDEEYQPLEEESDDEESRASGIFGFEEELLEELFSCGSPAVTRVKDNDPDGIGQRTRSKFSLNQTPLEMIEQAFIPPDITTDMYNTECDNQDWVNFLKAFSKPLDSSILNESVDDDNDPEYSVTVDDVEEKPDDEELRHDRAVKVSKKEVNALLTELYEYTNMVTPDPLAPDCLFDCLVEGEEQSLPSSPEPEPQYPVFEVEQTELIKQQMRQHVQLLLQSFLLSYGHPYIDSVFPDTFKSLLLDISKLARINQDSLFNVSNLPSALILLRKWERKVDSDSSITEHLKKEWEKSDMNRKRRVIYLPRLPELMMRFCLGSEAFVYPFLLPENGFRPILYLSRMSTTECELFAMGLEQFVKLIKENPDEFKDYSLEDILELVKAYLVPTKSVKYLMKQIDQSEKSKKMTPIKYYLTHGKTPDIIHYVVPIKKPLKKLIKQPYSLFTEQWVKFIEKIKSSKPMK